MRLITITLILGALAGGGVYLWNNTQVIPTIVNSYTKGEFRTLEARYSAEEIIQAQRATLLKKTGYSFLEPKLLFFPYLLMNVKYVTKTGETGEGTSLWSLSDAEMIIHTGTWEKTHGFEDCLTAQAGEHDFQVIETLMRSGGILEKEKIQESLHVDTQLVDKWIDSSKDKKLITSVGNKVRLHFQNPKLPLIPITTLDQPLVTQPTKYSQKMKRRYSPHQIARLSTMAFGENFAIRKTEEVFLPVFAIGVQNPDGSVLTTYWNALNGKKLEPSFYR